jgi:hypothetical protein
MQGIQTVPLGNTFQRIIMLAVKSCSVHLHQHASYYNQEYTYRLTGLVPGSSPASFVQKSLFKINIFISTLQITDDRSHNNLIFNIP